MPSFAEIVEGLSRGMRVLDGDGFDHDSNATKKSVALPQYIGAELTFNDGGEFKKIPGRNAAARGAADSFDVEFAIRLIRKDGDERRSIEDHFGRPCSS